MDQTSTPAPDPTPKPPPSTAKELPLELPPEPLELPEAEDLPEPIPASEPLADTTETERPHATPMRFLFTLAMGFVVVFLFLRTFAIEPFGVPTGSMAPTLIGNHRESPCPRCGYPVRVGVPLSGERPGYFANIPCPNCGKPVNLSQSREINGDRLLVDKNVYHLRRPRRWEVAVFRSPDPKDPLKPYVKRIIGLPGEEVTIVDGDAFANGILLRKSLAESRETRLPVYDMRYAPAPGGWGPRWFVYPADLERRLPRDTVRDRARADGSVIVDGNLVLDAVAQPDVRIEYRHMDLDAKPEARKDQPLTAWNSYDGAPGVHDSVHDFTLDCLIEIATAVGDASFACRLFDGADAVQVEIRVGAPGVGELRIARENGATLSSVGGVTLEPGRVYRLEFAFVDRRAMLAIDGKSVVEPADLPQTKKRDGTSRPLQLGARSCRVILRDLKLFRDIHYTQAGRHGTQKPALLGLDEYYLLGDNSGNSQDSREWASPGVPEADFIGKPFFVHQPLRLGRITVGGRERVFQTLDWSRLRGLH